MTKTGFLQCTSDFYLRIIKEWLANVLVGSIAKNNDKANRENKL